MVQRKEDILQDVRQLYGSKTRTQEKNIALALSQSLHKKIDYLPAKKIITLLAPGMLKKC